MSEANPTVQFRDVPDYPGYRVGDDGSVWSCWAHGGDLRRGVITANWHQLVAKPNDKGYLRVSVSCPDGKERKIKVHRLVLLAFVGPCPKGMECRHLDGIRANNIPTNLVWGTKRQNTEDRESHGNNSKGEQHPKAKLDDEKVRDIRRRYAAGGMTQRELGCLFQIDPSVVSEVISRKIWKHVD